MLRVVLGFASLLLASCGEPGPAKKMTTPPPETVEFFSGDSLEGWTVLDNWVGGGAPIEWTKGQVLIGAGTPMNGLKIDESRFTLPDKAYEIEVEAMRVEGRDIFLGLTFPVPGRGACVTFIAGGWGGGITGISSIDFRDASQNSTMSDQTYKNGQWYAFRIEARPDSIRAWMGERSIVGVNIHGRNIGMRPGEVEQVQPLGFVTWETVAAIRNLRIRELPDP